MTSRTGRPPRPRVLYLEGDACSPKYVEGALRAAGSHVDLQATAPRRMTRADCILLSDVAADDLGSDVIAEILSLVEEGAGLLAVGGWQSFGRGGYARTPLAEALPAVLNDGDDRLNLPGGAVVRARAPHEISEGLPLHEPPVLTGLNRLRVRPSASTVLEAAPIRVAPDGAVRLDEPLPLLMLGEFGAGRVAALATDPAPHWSGGLTDWGGDPIDVGGGEELGWAYVELLARLVEWTARSETARSRTRRVARAERGA